MRLRAVMAAVIATCLVELISNLALASNIAFDTAGDSAYNNGWTQGSSGGFGWGGGWNISTGDGSASLATDLGSGGEINSPVGLGGRSWEVTGDLTISRLFSGNLQIGQAFRIDVDPAPGAEYAVGIMFGNIYDHVSIAARGVTYQIGEEYSNTGLTTTTVTDIPVVNGPVRLSFTPISNNSYQLGITPLPGGATSTVTISYSSGPPDGFGLSTQYAPLYFNNVNVSPEPAALCFAGLATFGLLRRRKHYPARRRA